jgi:hypothetical protein
MFITANVTVEMFRRPSSSMKLCDDPRRAYGV